MPPIDGLPDDVLLEIFDFHTNSYLYYRGKKEIEVWTTLVHVCRRWRSLVLGSPRHLDLQLFCKPKTTKEALDIWPAFLPFVIRGDMVLSLYNMDNFIAILDQPNRVRGVVLWDFGVEKLGDVLAAMPRAPFPELTELQVWSNSDTPPVIPDSFLGGSAPRLRRLQLIGISFSKLRLSADRLVDLSLTDIPHSGYISPEAMVALVSMFSSLRSLDLKFDSPESRPGRQGQSLPPPEHSILPSLENFCFEGVIEYLEDLLTLVDTPQLETLKIIFFNQINFNCPRLAQFIKRTPLRAAEAHVQFDDDTAGVELRHRSSTPLSFDLSIKIHRDSETDLRLSFIEHVCSSSFHTISTVEDLYIEHDHSPLDWWNDAIENTPLLQLLLPFTAVKNLYISRGFMRGIAAALQELVDGRITEVLPSLQNIFVEVLEPSGVFQSNIERFVAARHLSGHPIAVSLWGEDPDIMEM